MTKLAMKIKPNKKQQECIDNLKGKFLVLAGPGTGKTFTIIQRIKAMIEQGIEGSKILCLTFTDAATNEMKTRLEKELNTLSTDVDIFTYHGFCCNILEDNPEDFELPHTYKIITEAVSRAFIKECIDTLNPKGFRTEKNDPYYYIETIKRRIEEIKKYRLTKEEYFENIEQNPDWKPELFALRAKLEEKNKKGDTRVKGLIADIESLDKKIEQAKELWEFYEAYQKMMSNNGYLDYNDMINFVLEKFENNPSFLAKIANKYEYIFVDEYQDTNYAQNTIVFNLVHALNSENVFVVGDDDQIIYSFQGAKLDTMENFLKEFPDTRVICLEENMRSTQNILDVARKLSLTDNKRLEFDEKFSKYNISKALTAMNDKLKDKNIPIRCYKYVDKMQEYSEIVEEIESLINSESCPVDDDGNKTLSEIAILTRSNLELAEFAEMLKAKNIPYELEEGKNIFKISAVNILYFYIQMLINPEMHSYRVFQLLLAQPFNINPKDYLKLYENVSKQKTFIDALRDIPRESFIEPEKIEKFIQTYDYLKIYKTKENIKNTILEIGSKTGIFNYYLNNELNRTESIAGLKRFVDEAIEFSNIYRTEFIEEFMDYLKILLNNDIEILTEKAPVTLNAIQLCTYYASKGREFEYVYMPTLNSEKWESYRGSFKPEIPLNISEYKPKTEIDELKMSDRIKVMYVGITRAKHTLRMSYVQTINGKPKKPSCLVLAIEDLLQKEETPFEYTEQTFWYQAGKALTKKDYDYKKDFCSLVDAKLANRAFSPTAINMYIKCPRQYLYDKILEFNGKDGNPDNFSYGSSVHFACEFLINKALENSLYPSKEEFIEAFKTKLNELPVSDYEQRKNLIGRGEKALDAFYAHMTNTPINWLYKVESPLNFELDNIKFYGIIDRIDKNPDGTYSIYDYKTGNAKSGVEIGGKHEDYYNQLGLYKYFFEKSTGEKVSTTGFIYPDDFTKNLTLELSNEECETIVENFKSAISKIRNYEFEPSYNPDACEYCGYKDFCQMEIV